MLERLEKPLRIVCLVLGGLVLLQVSRVALRKNPLDQLNIPELPSLTTNEIGQAEAKPTNSVAAPAGEKKQAGTASGPKETSGVVSAPAVEPKATNAEAQVSRTQTNSPVVDALKKSNELAQTTLTATNAASPSVVELKNTNAPGKGAVATSNLAAQAAPPGTNAPATNSPATNANKAVASAGMPPGGMMSGMRPSGGGKKPSTLPAAIQARVDKITESELLAPVIRPAPMALFGIAGDSAFLRGPKGQTGVVKEGEEIDGVKLLKIGFNRVLVEQDGEKKELMVFSGFGGESLLPKENKETPK